VAEDPTVILRVSLKLTNAPARSELRRSSEVLVVGKTRLPAGMAVSSSGSWLVVVGGHKAYVAQTSSLRSGFTKFVSPEALTCLAFHPSDDVFSTGDQVGIIRSWYCLHPDLMTKQAGVEKRAQTTTMHWHAHPVSALTYTPNGAYLLSGGEEAVLVIWQLHSEKKEFVPRVGSPIVSVSVNRTPDHDEEYVLGLADLSFTVISSTNMRIARVFTRIRIGTFCSS
jgi:NET1-associated nuclear protein 1 (U3 small nucleolar RNA-associated protein 17)